MKRDPLVFVRADGSTAIGIGHILRSLTLAQELKLEGYDVVFLCRELNNVLVKRIKDAGCGFVLIPKIEPFEQEKIFVGSLIKERKPQWIIVDHYGIKEDYYSFLGKHSVKILAIDDINHTRFPVNILLNQNIHALDLKYECLPKTVQLLGPQYALVRKIYQQRRQNALIRKELSNVLIFMGGGDQDNQTLKVFHAACSLRRSIKIQIVIGGAYPHRRSLEQEVKNSGRDVVIHQDLDHLADVMLCADLAIGSGGSVSWEMATMKLPMVLMPIAENQRGVVDSLAKTGAAINAGWFRDTSKEQLAKILVSLTDVQLAQMSQVSSGVCDGAGVSKVIKTVGSIS